MNNKFEKTIFALSSAWGMAGVSVIRISGDESKKVLRKLCNINLPKPRNAYYKKIFDLENNVIDQGVITFFESPFSYTGEDTIEISIHGSIAVIKKLLHTLKEMKDLRPSEPGEFSKRAFINKKANLLKVEGINNLINAETEEQRKVSISQILGKSENICKNWKKKLLNISALIDAQIEFSEEDEEIVRLNIKKQISILIGEMNKEIRNSLMTEKIINGLEIIIFGPPNAGKSSVFNLINREKKSIISEEAGTTRDQVSSSIDFKGHKIDLIDSAGIRVTTNKVENMGVEKTKEKIKEINHLILVVSPDSLKPSNITMIENTFKTFDKKKIIIFYNKSDLPNANLQKKHWEESIKFLKKYPSITISCVDNKNKHNNYEKSVKLIMKHLIEKNHSNTNYSVFSELRQIEHLKKALRFLEVAYNLSSQIELLSEEIRLSIKEIESITGNIDYEEKLGIIFSKFCIGK